MSRMSPEIDEAESCANNNDHHYSIPYLIFVYKEQLRKRDTHFIKLSKTKIHLTDTLISYSIRNISKYDVEEVMTINEQMLFKKRLWKKINTIRKLEKMGFKNIDPSLLGDDL